jgi:hypothetical protein
MNKKGTYQSPVPEGIVITSRSGYEGIILLAQVLKGDGKWVSLAVYDHYLSAEHTRQEEIGHTTERVGIGKRSANLDIVLCVMCE